jgi:hypothetical protein
MTQEQLKRANAINNNISIAKNKINKINNINLKSFSIDIYIVNEDKIPCEELNKDNFINEYREALVEKLKGLETELEKL